MVERRYTPKTQSLRCNLENRPLIAVLQAVVCAQKSPMYRGDIVTLGENRGNFVLGGAPGLHMLMSSQVPFEGCISRR